MAVLVWRIAGDRMWGALAAIGLLIAILRCLLPARCGINARVRSITISLSGLTAAQRKGVRDEITATVGHSKAESHADNRVRSDS